VSWLRFDDAFCEWSEWDITTTDVRWAYVCLVQACSRGKYWDGRLPKKRAIAALVAQVDNPQQCLERLAILSLIHELRREEIVQLPRIHEHIPPPGVRANTEKSKIRMRRKRAHDAGDHSLCLDTCPVTGTVTDLVTRNTRTGQDRTKEVVPQARDGSAS